MKAGEAYREQHVFINNSMHSGTFQYKEAIIVAVLLDEAGVAYPSIKSKDTPFVKAVLFSQLTPINEETWLEMRVLMACVNMIVRENFTEEDVVEEVLEMIRLYRPEENAESYREQIQQLVQKHTKK